MTLSEAIARMAEARNREYDVARNEEKPMEIYLFEEKDVEAFETIVNFVEEMYDNAFATK